MSSILKALKKLEDDKASRRPEELKIDEEILRTDDSPRFSPAGMLLTCLLFLLCGSVATFLYMRQDKTAEFANHKIPAINTKQAPSPLSDTANIKGELLPPAIEVVPAEQQKPVLAENFKRPKPQLGARTATATASPEPDKPVEQPKILDPAGTSKYPPPQHSTSAKPVPTLRVNGIAFQSNGTDSVAIVNGIPVTSGSIIEGVTVEEVHKERVLFQRNGEKFAIPLGQSNR